MARDPLHVVALVYDGLCTFEFGIAVEAFGLARAEFEQWYRFQVASADGGPVDAAGGVRITPTHTLRALDRAGTIVIPGWCQRGTAPAPLIAKLRRAADQGARLVSICSGAFLLAATGLLDGRRATTHWRYARELAERHPEVDVDPDVLYVDEGQLLSSAGSAAGIDLCLHLIRRDFGATTANRVARRLVVPPHREAGQRQFIDRPIDGGSAAGAIASLLQSLRADLGSEHTVADLARRANLSERTFARRFRAATGTTPHRWLQRERVLRTQELLETTDLPLDTIAARVGFSDAQLLRLHFKRVAGTTPTAYRRTFSGR